MSLYERRKGSLLKTSVSAASIASAAGHGISSDGMTRTPSLKSLQPSPSLTEHIQKNAAVQEWARKNRAVAYQRSGKSNGRNDFVPSSRIAAARRKPSKSPALYSSPPPPFPAPDRSPVLQPLRLGTPFGNSLKSVSCDDLRKLLSTPEREAMDSVVKMMKNPSLRKLSHPSTTTKEFLQARERKEERRQHRIKENHKTVEATMSRMEAHYATIKFDNSGMDLDAQLTGSIRGANRLGEVNPLAEAPSMDKHARDAPKEESKEVMTAGKDDGSGKKILPGSHGEEEGDSSLLPLQVMVPVNNFLLRPDKHKADEYQSKAKLHTHQQQARTRDRKLAKECGLTLEKYDKQRKAELGEANGGVDEIVDVSATDDTTTAARQQAAQQKATANSAMPLVHAYLPETQVSAQLNRAVAQALTEITAGDSSDRVKEVARVVGDLFKNSPAQFQKRFGKSPPKAADPHHQHHKQSEPKRVIRYKGLGDLTASGRLNMEPGHY